MSHHSAPWNRRDPEPGTAPGLPQIRPAVAVELQSDGALRCVRAEIGGERLRVQAAREFAAGDRTALVAFAAGATVSLVVNSERSVFRRLDVPSVPPEALRALIALRLEAELPYPVADAAWLYGQGGASANGKHAFAAAVPKADLDTACAMLRETGIACAHAEYDASALAELAGGEAVARIDTERIVLTVVRDGAPVYVRRVRLTPPAQGAPEAQSEWESRVVRAIAQSLQECQMRGGGSTIPLRVTGSAQENSGLLNALRAALGAGITKIGLPAFCETDSALVAESVMVHYPACTGALIALHRRARGEQTLTPPLLTPAAAASGLPWGGRRPVLLAGCVAAGLLLLTSAFAVRSARVAAAEETLAELKPLSGALARVQEEVDILQFENKRASSVLDLFKAIATAMPPEVSVKSVNLASGGKLTLKGKTRSVAAASEKAIAALETSGLFKKCIFLGATEEQNEFSFQISCELGRNSQGSKP